ncbi:unnamed protein product [Oreochromis niloticus]|nr:unnamed protein product [Mustela putorius furo]
MLSLTNHRATLCRKVIPTVKAAIPFHWKTEKQLWQWIQTFLIFGWIFLIGYLNKKNITAESGQNVTLTCRAPNNNNDIVEWSRADFEPKHVLVYRGENFVPDEQHPSFKDRVDLQDRQMKDGDVSLILKDVTINDTGTYECRVLMGETRSWKSISSISLSVVDPPGHTGGRTKDEGKEDGVNGGHPGLEASRSFLVLLLLLGVLLVL